MKTRILLFFAFVTTIFTSCTGQTTKGIQTIPAAAFAQKIKSYSNAQILDVRTPAEFEGEHIDGAANVNWNSPDFEQKAAKYDKSKPVFVYCKVGGRSKQAAEKLRDMGFTEVYDLEGGMMKWSAAGFSKPGEKIVGMCSQEYAEALKGSKKMLVNFYADWCEPCKKMTPYLLKMQSDLKDEIAVLRLNADENRTLVADLKLDALPVLLLYENGNIVWQHNGFISEEDLKKQL